jgi:two-component system capsular synthesis sensor histidine kinase RcsC
MSDGALGRRLLLVEDDPDNREAMISLLALNGFDVTGVECGAAAVRAFAIGGPFDVVLTDLDLPDINGWEVARRIKHVSPDLPVALITGFSLSLDDAEVRRRGIDLILKKPLDPRDLVGHLAALLQDAGRSPSA